MEANQANTFQKAVVGAYLGGFALLLAVILWLNEGRFAYSLDDAYIHLALAENLASGHLGLNLHEASSPSSSMLWPLLLAPLSGLERFELLPLILNVAAMTWALLLMTRFLMRALPQLSSGSLALVLLAVVLVCNFWGMPFNGMEHSFQILLSVAVVIGLAQLVEHGRVPIYLPIALLLGPLIRFENASLLVMGTLVLALRGHRRKALALLAVAGALAIAFVTYHWGQGLGWMPSSVLTKSQLAAADSFGSMLFEIGEHIVEASGKTRITVPLALMAVIFLRARRDPANKPTEKQRLSLLFLGGVLLAHTLAGRYDWYGRYEVYVMVVAVLVLLPFFGQSLSKLGSQRKWVALAALILAAIYTGKNQLYATFTTPLSANNIYEMHGQMHRFVVEEWRDAVAVNDIGWVSYRNPHYVLDLWGLGSEEARRARRHATDNDWAESLAKAKNIDLLMLFETWFIEYGPLPESWEKLAVLTISRRAIQVPRRQVDFFLRNPARRDEALRSLRSFRAELPPGVELVLEQGGM